MRALWRFLLSLLRRAEARPPQAEELTVYHPGPNYEVLYGQHEGKLRRLIRRMTRFPLPPRELEPLGPAPRIPHNHPTARALVATDPTCRRPTLKAIPLYMPPEEENTPRPVDVGNDITKKGPTS